MLPANTTIDQLTTEILIYKGQTASNIIEIGKRLIQAKSLLQHGEWGKWLAEEVEFSQSTAGRFMKASEEFGNSAALTNLPQTKVFALLDIPQAHREEFIQSNPVNEMTTRELQAAIKARKQAEEKAKEAERKANESNEKVDDLVTEVKRLNKEVSSEPEPQTIEVVKEIIVEVIPPDYEKLKARVEEQRTELNHLTRAQLTMKDKQKVKTDATILVQELTKNAERLEFDYQQVGDLDKDTDQFIESAAKVCDRTAQKLRSLIYTMEVQVIG